MIAFASVIVCGPYRSLYGEVTISSSGSVTSILIVFSSPSVPPDPLAGSVRLAGSPR